MNSEFVKVATYTPEIKVFDVEYNVETVKKGIDLAENNGVHVVVFPELCLTGSTIGDLIYSKTLLDGAKNALLEIANYTKDKNLIAFVGLPFEKDGQVYSATAGLSNGKVLGVAAKDNLSSDGTFFSDILFRNDKTPNFTVGFNSSANIVIETQADPEYSGRIEFRRNYAKSFSERNSCIYLYANAGDGESTTDCVYSGHSLICENGEILAESKPFENGLTVAEVDLGYISFVRSKKKQTFADFNSELCFDVDISDFKSTRIYDKTPFIKKGEEELLLNIQAHALKKRILHTHAEKLVLGLSGGLDSTLALIVAVKAMLLAGKSQKDVLAITMPCFGTSSRTFDNSIKLAKAFGVQLKKVDIAKSVKRHFKDIEHPEDVHDAAYENAQARERTQVLMDTANMVNGLVVGTGDLSELALGWATYNGDHMSMYAVNGSIPKTLVRHLVTHVALTCKGKAKSVLLDVVDTPVSPELLPPADDKIKQVTEDIVGPYILHDYFLYSMINKGFSPKKIYQTAVNTFKGEFDEQTILKWLKTFIRRFFTQQFKRSCLPDGVKVTEISLSPRKGWNMPSDGVSKLWLAELENL